MIKLIMADENQNYIRALSQYLQNKHGHAFDIACFTQPEALKEYLQNVGGADILLMDEKMGLFDDLAGIKLTIIMTDIYVENGSHKIYKYQRAEQIVKEIIEYADRLTVGNGFIHKSEKRCKTICVFSPAGASGKTTIANNLASQYALVNQKVLLVSMETFSDLPLLPKKSNERGIIYLMHLIKSKLPNLQLKLNAYLSMDDRTGVYSVERESNILEYKDIKMEDIGLLIDFFRSQSDFDALIFDMDSAISEAGLGLFKECDIIMNVQSGRQSRGKQMDFSLQVPKIESYLKTDIQDKMLTVFNKNIDLTSENEMEIGQCTAALTIPYTKGLEYGNNSYSPEMAIFKKLYDIVENFLFERGM